MLKKAANRKSSEKITVITRDNIRQLKPHSAADLIPRREVVLSIGELNMIKVNYRLSRLIYRFLIAKISHSLKEAAKFLKPQDLEAKKKYTAQGKEEVASVARSRREKMEKFDTDRAKNAKLSDLDRDTLLKSSYLLTKAQAQLEEQEDEIKHLNELMVYAKCVTVRDVQVEQKVICIDIERDRKDEELRLDAMMESTRVAEVLKLEVREQLRVDELRKGAAKIRAQIEERREAALLEQEKKDQETKLLLKQIADTNEAERVHKASKVAAQKKLMQGVNAANDASKELKKVQKMKDEDEDRKVLEYILAKEAKEAESDRIAGVKRGERELELSRLRAAQEKMADKRAEQDALRAQRAYEGYERDWRKKEKEGAEKQARLECEIREERIKQQQAKEDAIAQESALLKEQFNGSIARQKETEAKIKSEAISKAARNREYALEVQAQIREKELNKRKAREEFFSEGVRLATERGEKAKKIDAIKERKIQELRDMGVPDKYLLGLNKK